MVSRSMPPAVSSRPASRNRWIGSSKRRHSSGVGRTPAAQAQPDEEVFVLVGQVFGGSAGSARRNLRPIPGWRAHAAVEGMGVRAETHVGLQFPIFEIVARFAARDARNSRSRNGRSRARQAARPRSRTSRQSRRRRARRRRRNARRREAVPCRGGCHRPPPACRRRRGRAPVARSSRAIRSRLGASGRTVRRSGRY